ncbi:unnamed protein product, partial [marine sediment metagenome]
MASNRKTVNYNSRISYWTVVVAGLVALFADFLLSI